MTPELTGGLMIVIWFAATILLGLTLGNCCKLRDTQQPTNPDTPDDHDDYYL